MPSPDAAERSLTIQWDDPMIGARAAQTLSGLEYLREMESGRIPPPPVMKLLGFDFVRAAEGEVEFAFVPHESHFNPIGSVHGGVISTLLDSAMGCSVHSLLPRGKGYTTLELKVNFVRAVQPRHGKLLCCGQVIHAGGRMATAEARLQDEAGKLYAHATTTCMIFDAPAG
ncbi:PaaI family thioesterase [Pseudogulbenkiania ferrooxidans]|uniref:Aromatic compound degradation protein PaaI n=1 Tax=Pseudogulbenkiania ferrooxidans EGD-HP2 TaxID=1388764 RepID=A0ABP2XRN0_9NEIS|nr:PaaI family thioesterase [Pseudogulbenkiania ferrooxidans]ERE19868.1 aromatic compound degradation protein PaaI [Pseudogulbenkiania ferrooxidans EGD-HP2]